MYNIQFLDLDIQTIGLKWTVLLNKTPKHCLCFSSERIMAYL